MCQIIDGISTLSTTLFGGSVIEGKGNVLDAIVMNSKDFEVAQVAKSWWQRIFTQSIDLETTFILSDHSFSKKKQKFHQKPKIKRKKEKENEKEFKRTSYRIFNSANKPNCCGRDVNWFCSARNRAKRTEQSSRGNVFNRLE